MLEITSLPAKQGDAIWVKWGDAAHPHQMIIDMGTGAIGKSIRQQIEALPEDRRKFDLLVITHVDADHIGGVLTCLAEADPIPGLALGDVWFNGFEHLTGGTITTASNLEPLGPVQGEKLSAWLRQHSWNKAFSGGPVSRVPGANIEPISLYDGLQLSVLGPTPERLSKFVDKWQDDVREAIDKGRLEINNLSPGLEALGSDDPPLLENDDDLKKLAEKDNSLDASEANGSSIALLLEYKERKLLLSGDAFSDDLIDGINAVSPDNRLHLDLFKLPHHGSKKNVHIELIKMVDCECWLISSDGTRFKHPDAEAIARVIEFSNSEKPLLSFNVPSKFNQWWQNPHWESRFNYDVEYGTEQDGLSIRFEFDE
ncbi:MAG: MBL fold metallo-hydrolase [Gammaproteobacteria bacterium]|nr:MBL fold metallo-hydrolase [Gammaproteobacteria bacterium]